MAINLYARPADNGSEQSPDPATLPSPPRCNGLGLRLVPGWRGWGLWGWMALPIPEGMAGSWVSLQGLMGVEEKSRARQQLSEGFVLPRRKWFLSRSCKCAGSV